MRPPAGQAELDQAVETLSIVLQIRDEGRERFAASVDRQLAAAHCWPNIGSALKQFYRRRGIRQSASPFPGPIRMRDKMMRDKMLYQPLSDLSPDILWDTCVHNAEPLMSLL